ncbi:hypothetical protein K439DRAFT_604247 [Ramaria rubella]|nr:hypothetical protein K439DRAFT_604247 [Ramaria rubella]
MQSQCRYTGVTPLRHDYWLAHSTRLNSQFNRSTCWRRDDPHCGLSASTMVEFSTYVDATVVGRSACSHTDHQQDYMNISVHVTMAP